MSKYSNLELSILSCLLLRPKLMENIKLEDKHFIKYKRLWIFMKKFYQRFKCFDIDLMYSITNDKYQLIEYIVRLLECESAPSMFYKYQERLIEQYNESQKEKWVVEKIYDLANELYVRSITSDEFKIKLEKIYNDANEIYKKGDE